MRLSTARLALTRSKPASSQSQVRIRNHSLPPLWRLRPERNTRWRCSVRARRNTSWCSARFPFLCLSSLFLSSSSSSSS